MTNTEKYAFPVIVGAAILGIWAALRKPGSSPAGYTTAGLASSGAGLPPIPPAMGQYLAPVPSTAPSIAPAGAGSGQNRSIINLVQSSPWNPNPFSNGGFPPAQWTYNQPPAGDWNKHIAGLVASSQEPASGGCGGCSGCGSKSGGSKCAARSDNTNNRFSDGRGGCLTTKPKVGDTTPAALNADLYMQQTRDSFWHMAPPAYDRPHSA